MKTAALARVEAWCKKHVPAVQERELTDDELLSALEVEFEMVPGSLPRTALAAAAAGRASIADFMAVALGMDLRQFNQWTEAVRHGQKS